MPTLMMLNSGLVTRFKTRAEAEAIVADHDDADTVSTVVETRDGRFVIEVRNADDASLVMVL